MSRGTLLAHRLAGCPARRRMVVLAQGRRGMAELLSFQDKSIPAAQLTPHKVSPRLPVPPHITRPPYVDTGENPWLGEIQVHSAEGIAKMRASCRLAADVLHYAGTLVKPGVTTDSIDKAVHRMIVDHNAYPSPLTYGNFPKSVCTSVNECVCHGIPDSRALLDGDIVNIDVTVYLNGYHGDTSRMFYVGNVSDDAKRLCETTIYALEEAIKICGPGVPVKDIGKVIHGIADKTKYGVVRDFVGHGVGWAFHSKPYVMHCRNREPGVMTVGQTFTIEPMFTMGSTKVRTWNDKWTVVTADGKPSAQFEHTLLITKDGHDVLTTWPSA